MQHIKENVPIQAPPETWWVHAAVVAQVCQHVNICLAKLQSKNLIISQQKEGIGDLVANFCTLVGVNMVKVGSNEEHENCDVFKRGQWKVSRDDVVSFIEDQGSFA